MRIELPDLPYPADALEPWISRRTLEVIRARLAAELARQPWWREPYSSVRVAEGVVHYSGFVQSPEERDAARVAAQNVPGVRAVEDHRYAMSDIPAMV